MTTTTTNPNACYIVLGYVGNVKWVCYDKRTLPEMQKAFDARVAKGRKIRKY
jgi:hypothetical protein